MKRLINTLGLCAVITLAPGILSSVEFSSESDLFGFKPLLMAQAVPTPATEEQATGVVVFPTDRNLIRKMRQTRELIKEGHFSDAVMFLDRILAEQEDSFFNPQENKQVYRSLKTEALRLIGELPPEGKASYRLLFGDQAQRLLRQAVEQGDENKLEQVARRYFHTKPGQEATLLLGRKQLDEGHVLQAAVTFQQLLDNREAAKRFDPELSVLAAICWSRANMNDRAEQTLLSLKEKHSDSKPKIGGRRIGLFKNDRGALEWLHTEVGAQRISIPGIGEEWLTFRGNALRNAESGGGTPLLIPQWRVRTIDNPASEANVDRLRASFAERGVPKLPCVHPLAVDGVVLSRTMRNILAVDMKTGRRLWEVRPPLDDPLDEGVSVNSRVQRINQTSQFALAMRQRLWDDAIYGTMSSDGERVFAIRGLEMARSLSRSSMLAIRAAQTQGLGVSAYNRLSAFELKSEGKLVWEVGGPESDEEVLREAFFLGPPLALSGELYALAEIKSSVRLIVLNADSGELLWSQQLVDLENTVDQDIIRRLTGATPSFSNGVLICPTSAGAVVAVDLARRSLSWAYQYPQRYPLDRHRALLMARARQLGEDENDRWLDGSVTLASGKVLLTPTESNELHCVDLLDGGLLWKQPRGEGLYLACVVGGKVILVGKNDITAVELEAGKIIWEAGDCPLPKNTTPSGRGFLTGDKYFLSVDSGEIVSFDLAEGKLVDRAKTRDGTIPGNLVCYQDNIISFTADSLDAYYQLGPLKKRVKATLAKNPSDSNALARQGEIALSEERLDDAIQSFRLAYQQEPSGWSRELLSQSLFTALEQDFATYRAIVPELQAIVQDPHQQQHLLRLVASGLHAAGEIERALDTYFQLADLTATDDPLEAFDSQWSARSDCWIHAQLVSLYETATPEVRREIDRKLAERRLSFEGNATAEKLAAYLRLFGDVGSQDDVRLQLAQMKLDAGRFLEAESLLLDLETSDDDRSVRAATALMAELLVKANRPKHAAIYYRRLGEEMAEVVCWKGKTGRELVGDVDASDPVRLALEERPPWAFGAVEAKEASGPVKPASRYGAMRRAIKKRGSQNPFFDDTSLFYDNQKRSIVAVDSYGAEQYAIPFREAIATRTGQSRGGLVGLTQINQGVNAQSRGHQLFVYTGNQVIALDTFAEGAVPNRLLWDHDGAAELRAQNSASMFLVRRRSIYSQRTSAQGLLGLVTRHGVIVRRQRELVCVDSLTGEDIWTQTGIAPQAELFGSDERLFVIPPGQREAIVLRPRDGKRLGVCKLPQESERIKTDGHLVLQQESGMRGEVELRLFDPWSETTHWDRTFDRNCRVKMVGADKVAVLSRSGKLNIVSLKDGKDIVAADLGDQRSMLDLYVIESEDQYLCFVKVPLINRIRNRTVTRYSPRFPDSELSSVVFTGRVWAFDRKSGQSLWQSPVMLSEKSLLPGQPAALPFLVFVQQERRNVAERNTTHGTLLCLDKRTGQVVLEEEGFQSGGLFTLSGNPALNETVLSAPNKRYHIHTSSSPVAPEPTFQDTNYSTNPKHKVPGY